MFTDLFDSADDHAHEALAPHEAGSCDDLLTLALWDALLEAASACPLDVGFVETRCGPPVRAVHLGARHAHLLAPQLFSFDRSPTRGLARALRSTQRLQGTFLRWPGSPSITLPAVTDRLGGRHDTFALLADVDRGAFEALARHSTYRDAFHRTKVAEEDAYVACERLGDRLDRVAKHCANRLLVGLARGRRFEAAAPFDPRESSRGVLFADRLRAWATALLEASADPPDAALLLAPTEGTEAALAAVDDAIAALGLPRTAARLRLEGPNGEVAHAALVGVGTHGSAIVAEVANAPWHESPPLAAFGCAVRKGHVEER
jgi:hypothetical protein